MNKVERETFEEYRQIYQVTPASPNALRVWKKMYCDFTTAPDNPDTRKVYDLFVEQNHGLPPASAVSLKAWYTQVKTQPAARGLASPANRPSAIEAALAVSLDRQHSL